MPAARDNTAAGSPKGGHMLHIKVRYDARSRTFKLVDQDFRTLLEGDALYDLAIPLVFDEIDVEEFVTASNAFIAHA
jgi:hypothetical protein